MEVFVDDKRVDETFIKDGTVEETLRHVQTHFCPPESVVVTLRCNGREIDGSEMIEALKERAASFERLDVFTGTRARLVTEAMTQASACLQDTGDRCQHVASLFTEGKTVDGAKALGECLKIWQQVHEAIGKSIEMLQLDPEQAMVEGEPFMELIRRPKEALLQVRDALQVQDYVLLADILQYEFSDVTDQWQRLITHLHQVGEAGAVEGGVGADGA